MTFQNVSVQTLRKMSKKQLSDRILRIRREIADAKKEFRKQVGKIDNEIRRSPQKIKSLSAERGKLIKKIDSRENFLKNELLKTREIYNFKQK